MADDSEGDQADEPALEEQETSLNGIDINENNAYASNTRCILDYTLPGDFVIIKATEGTYMTNALIQEEADWAVNSGMLIGFYHFASNTTDGNNTDPAAQARYFVDVVEGTGYLGQAILILDWENTSYSNIMSEGPAWAKRWLDTVYSLTGVRSLIYMSSSVTRETDGKGNYVWSDVARDYELWVAAYPSRLATGKVDGYQYVPQDWFDPGDLGPWDQAIMHQYSDRVYLTDTKTGRQYPENFDANRFFGTREDWLKLAAAGHWEKTVKKVTNANGTTTNVTEWRYYMPDENGDMYAVTGWQRIRGVWYYFNPSTTVMHEGWLTLSGKKYYLTPVSGARAAGWQKLSNKWYYFTPSTGIMRRDETFTVSGKTYVANSAGVCPANAIVSAGGKWYITDSSCAIRKGWVQRGGSWYYLNPSTGVMRRGETFTVSGKTYVANTSGVCPASSWVQVNGKWYLTDSSCAIRRGWAQTKGKWYYLNPSNGVMRCNEVFTVNGKTYVANTSGACPANGWVKVSGKWYLTDSSCAVRRGWATVNGKRYYLSPTSGEMLTGFRTIEGKRYYLDPTSGAMATGWREVKGKWYYFNASGVMATSCWVGNYYLGADGIMLTDTVTPDGYRVLASGKWDGKPKVSAA